MVLFWHHVFATGIVKVENSNEVMNQIAMFREHGMGSYRDLIVGLARDPAMIFSVSYTHLTLPTKRIV